MASLPLLRSSARPDLSLCARCAFRASNRSRNVTRRWIGDNHVAEADKADREWQAQALEIRQGRRKSMLTKLEERGLVHTVTGNRDDVDKIMTGKRVGAYVGIDPTASSLHVGHLLPLMSLFWMYVHGYHTISLIGGATAKIGDPTDRLTTREVTKEAVRTQNVLKIQDQLKKLWLNVEEYGKKYGYSYDWTWKRALLNNDTWMKSLPMMEFLQVLGPGMRMGAMLARDTVKNKMKKGDGMSFAEFTYPLLQAWDWWHMYNTLGVQMQIGGSDQYGNITAGIDAVKYIATSRHDPAEVAAPFGFTVPLLATSAGQKFGKSAGNAIWLDPNQTSSFELYKFFLGTSDADVGRYLKLFTFMPIEKIDTLVEEHMKEASLRKAQHALARDFVELVHGEQEAKYAESQHRLIYAKNTLSPEEFATAQEALQKPPITGAAEESGESVPVDHQPTPHLKLPRSAVEVTNIGKVLLACGLVKSASEGHRLAEKSSVHVGGLNGGPENGRTVDGSLTFRPIKQWKLDDPKRYLIYDTLLIFRRGKHQVKVIEVVSDDEYEALGLEHPGMKKPGSEDEADRPR